MENKTLKVFQSGFNYSQDGPGNRLVFHLQGCNFRCPWCSNPESIAVQGSLIVDEKYLVDSVCPYGAIKDKKIDRSMCETCKTKDCISEKNRNKGIRLSYKEMKTQEIVNLAVSCKESFYDGGGVTFSGGEATLQFDALEETLRGLKENGINTTIETNGTAKNLEKLFNVVDHLIIDYKIPFSNRHKEILQHNDQQTKENIILASQKHPDLLVRIPLVHNVNDRQEDLAAFLEFFDQCHKEGLKIEFLKYHDYGSSKWGQIGQEYVMSDDSHISSEKYDSFVAAFKDANYQVIFT